MAERMYCTHCGMVATTKRYTKGSFVIELALWLFFLIPGLIYSLWRLGSRYQGCPSCQAAGMIGLDSPKAQAELAKQSGGQ